MVLLLILDCLQFWGDSLNLLVILYWGIGGQKVLVVWLFTFHLFFLGQKLDGLFSCCLDWPGDGDAENNHLSIWTDSLSKHNSEERSKENTWHGKLHDFVVDSNSFWVLWMPLIEVQNKSENSGTNSDKRGNWYSFTHIEREKDKHNWNVTSSSR